MANEAVIVNLLGNGGDPVDGTVLNANAFEKGTVMILSGQRTISGSTTMSEVPFGIAAAEKEASDGSTNLACYTHVIADLVCQGADGGILAGQMVVLSGANTISGATSLTDPKLILGKALEDGVNGARCEVLVRL